MNVYLAGVLIILHVVGIFGIQSGSREWFLDLTPVNLLLTFFIVLLSMQKANALPLIALVVLSFLGGFGAEYIGVHTGLLFGDYAYGEGLGPAWEGIPYAIGMNWAMLILITRSLSNQISNNRWIQPIIGAFLMVVLDLWMEPVAPILDYWSFNGVAPFSNYAGWFGVALLLHYIGTLLGAHKWDCKADVLVYTVQSAFFLVLILV